MTRALGPLDKRKRLSRCQACATRRIKCDGGFPCHYCVRTNKYCQQQSPKSSKQVKFVAVIPETSQLCARGAVGQPVPSQRDAQFLDYFANFLQRCQFNSDFTSIMDDILPLFQSSAILRDIALGIGALEASRIGSVQSLEKRMSPRFDAYRLYGRCMKAFRNQLESKDYRPNEQTLWITFLLGLFELMSSSSAANWPMHMVHGMSKVVQSMSTAAKQSSRKLIEVYRYLEATRTISYGTDTYLSVDEPPLPLNVRKVSVLDSSLQFMLRCARLVQRLFTTIEHTQQKPGSVDVVLLELAQEGRVIQQELLVEIQATKSSTSLAQEYQLATINCCAALLFICRSFAYYDCWEDHDIPRLDQDQTKNLTDTITHLSENILCTTHIPGLLLLFPLRVVGTYAADSSQKSRVLNLLHRVYQQGFAISSWIQSDLEALWQWSSIMQ